MGEKRIIVFAVILLALIGVYVWYSQRTKIEKPTAESIDVAKVDPKQALARTLSKAIDAYEKEKGMVPKTLGELKGKYVDPKTIDEALAQHFQYEFVNPHSYRMRLPRAPVKLAAKKQAAKKGEPTAKKGASTSTELATTETGWKYNPAGKADPFKSFIIARRASSPAAVPKPEVRRRPLTQLEKMPLSEIQRGLKVIIWGKMGNKALVEDATGKGYVVEVGTYVGQKDGIVKKILQDRIVVEQSSRDSLTDKETTNEVVLKLKKTEGED
jgi:Tfp pilus assembly protein PilP